jgi:hypothetical protein
MNKKDSLSSDITEAPRKHRRAARKGVSSQKEVGETRATFIIEETLLKKVKAVAYWERKQIKAVLHEALTSFVKDKGDMYIEQALTEQKNNGQ